MLCYLVLTCLVLSYLALFDLPCVVLAGLGLAWRGSAWFLVACVVFIFLLTYAVVLSLSRLAIVLLRFLVLRARLVWSFIVLLRWF